jgi:hypothetical protein
MVAMMTWQIDYVTVALENSYFEMDAVQSRAAARIKQVQNSHRHERAAIVRTALASLVHLRAHLTYTLSGLQLNEPAEPIADDVAPAWRLKRSRWGALPPASEGPHALRLEMEPLEQALNEITGGAPLLERVLIDAAPTLAHGAAQSACVGADAAQPAAPDGACYASATPSDRVTHTPSAEPPEGVDRGGGAFPRGITWTTHTSVAGHTALAAREEGMYASAAQRPASARAALSSGAAAAAVSGPAAAAAAVACAPAIGDIKVPASGPNRTTPAANVDPLWLARAVDLQQRLSPAPAEPSAKVARPSTAAAVARPSTATVAARPSTAGRRPIDPRTVPVGASDPEATPRSFVAAEAGLGAPKARPGSAHPRVRLNVGPHTPSTMHSALIS